MRSGISILVLILAMTGMMHLTIANHFCGGMLVATRVSLSGHLASCGMETTETGMPGSGSKLSGHCCDDDVVTLVTDNNYVASDNFILNHHQYKYQILNPPVLFSSLSENQFKAHLTNVMPPGIRPSLHKDCPDICVFRI